jgi:hypothetical protein
MNPWKNKFHMTMIVKLWSKKIVMYLVSNSNETIF